MKNLELCFLAIVLSAAKDAAIHVLKTAGPGEYPITDEAADFLAGMLEEHPDYSVRRYFIAELLEGRSQAQTHRLPPEAAVDFLKAVMEAIEASKLEEIPIPDAVYAFMREWINRHPEDEVGKVLGKLLTE
jgi:hypothetical protein